MACRIEVLNSVWCICNKEAKNALNDILCYTTHYWKQGPRRKKKVQYVKRMITPYEGKFIFHTGLLDRALDFLEDNNYDIDFTDNTEPIECSTWGVPGIEMWGHQRDLIEETLNLGRGVIKAATGTGKSYVLLGIISAFPKSNILLLVHTKVLVSQLKKDLKKFFGKVGEYSGSKKDIQRITVGTMQSFVKVAEDYCDHFDVLIVDETHHVSNLDGNYGKIIQVIDAPVKIGCTATLPEKEEGKMVLEALIGPIIGEFSIQDAAREGILAVPDIKIIDIPVMDYNRITSSVGVPFTYDKDGNKIEPSMYKRVYHNGIIMNDSRNRIIMQEAYKITRLGKSVLINIINIKHGYELMNHGRRVGVNCTFIHGKTPQDEREKIKKDFIEKRILCIIGTTVFNEGVDFPTLNTCINAASGKGEIAVLQKIGRGLRKSEGKSRVKIIDLKDTSHKYLRDHFKKRYSIYLENGWL